MFNLQSLLLFLGLSALATATHGIASENASRPNILYFYVDDMGWGSIGPNGQAARRTKNLPYVRTPNLDELARQGVNFTRGYGCHVCSPARSSQQTGFHQGHTFADRNDPDNAKKAMRSDDVLIGDALSEAGYVTGYWGKWGYGGSKDQNDPIIENVQTLPTTHGYKHVLAELHHVRAHTFFQPTLWSAPASADAAGGLKLINNSMRSYQGNGSYPDFPALQNHADYPEIGYCDDAYAFAALDFVRKQGQNYRASGQPFFGLLAVQIPHAPFDEISALPEWNREYAQDPKFASLSDQTRQWAAMVTRIDAHFGNILAALDDPNNDGDTSDSIANETLIIFQSDNGGPGGKNNAELDANGGLSGNKGKIQEGGIRVPLVMRWPEMIHAQSKLKAGTNCEMVVDVSDLLPTFCDLAGVPAPLGIDGVSIAPTLTGSGHQRKRDFVIHEASNGQSIIRGNYKMVRAKKARLSLYDLDQDRTESNDIAADHPELVNELNTLLLGERVTEPRGFANTYHRWIGADGETTSKSQNWSDYIYANAGKTYLEDRGAPQLSWIAKIENLADQPNVARADKNLNVLGLEIRGKPNGHQSLVLSNDVQIVGRNEIRLSPNSTLSLNGGTLSTLRWIDVHQGAMLRGPGTINGNVCNDGTIKVDESDLEPLQIQGEYQQSQKGNLTLALKEADKSPMQVGGEVVLDGTLAIKVGKNLRPSAGESYTVLVADRITGKFSNKDNTVVANDGMEFTIQYLQEKIQITTE